MSDGTWSGHVFDFYRIVYRKLTNPEGLKILFRLQAGQRQDDTPEQVFGVPNSTVEHKAISTNFYSEGSVENKVLYDGYGSVLSPMLNAPAIDDLETLSPNFYKGLQIIAQESTQKQRLNPEVIRTIIFKLCEGHYITRPCLAQLLNRNPDSLRQLHLGEMIKNKTLSLAFPQNPNDKRQAYIATVSLLTLNKCEGKDFDMTED